MHDRVFTRPGRVRFGTCVVDRVTGEMWRDGQAVTLQQKPFRLLSALIERPGELVTREELRYVLWSEATHVSFERGLTVAMAKLRHSLGETAEHPRYIETLPGRGYRLIVPVSCEPECEATPVSQPPIERPRHRTISARTAAAAAVLLIVGLTVPSQVSVSAADRLAAAEALSDYACQLKAAGRLEQGLAVIRRAHALAPEVARFTAEVGLHLHANKQYGEEMSMLRRAVAQDPASAVAWLHLGLGLARRDQMADAVEALERAAATDPDNAQARWWLTWARGVSTVEP